ncbi:CPBP family intramembrane glutamic endopeptidase [Sandaracinus amylolyticus]|uniref:CPBP family intramembrane glutamic endopeptidase n=1 Tax=Sandaracinus amylolyticus TaxID=927083 RepID=UPI001F1A419D|nr:CPBP family intramembrane glutamic endopeptidase [Sandaracinus amylolyticus]UJR86754.1 Hypothetical protein I5071_88550 [Sandaracinus amylolyticus]
MRAPRGQLSIAQTVALLVLGLGLLYGGVLVGAAIRAAVHGVSLDEGVAQVTSEPFGPGLAQLIALGTVILFGVRVAYGDRSLREALRIVPVRAPVALLAMIAGLSLHFPLVELMTVLSDMVPGLALDEEAVRRVEEMTRIDGPLRAITVPFTVIVVAAGTEELLFRGLLLPALTPRLGRIGALVLTSVLFGVFHVEPFAATYAMIAGLVLGAIALRTGSVLPCIAFHGAFNALPILLPEEVIAVPGFNVAESEAHLPPGLLVATTLAGVIALVLLWRITSADEPTPPQT